MVHQKVRAFPGLGELKESKVERVPASRDQGRVRRRLALFFSGLGLFWSQGASAEEEQPMCPACTGIAMLMVGTVVSMGGLTSLIVKVFHLKKNVQALSIEECNSKEK